MSSDLQNKLFHFEADPPKEVWNKITGALDADAEETFPQRLFTYEEQPPANTWNNIEASLEETEPAIKVVPITKFKKPLRYVAAAASIIGIIFLATTIANKKTGAGAAIGGAETTVTPPAQSSVLPMDKPKLVEDSTANEHTSKQQLADESIAKNNLPKKRALTFIRPQGMFRSFAFSNQSLPQKANKEELLNYSELDSYMVYSDGDGNAMKLPKKLFSLVHCQDGDYTCKERIKQLQQKMASGATTTDFAGIIEILRQLQ
ncbi:MAG TPA: hypothetical protein VF609_07080 [Flavisolibacter sp.]